MEKLRTLCLKMAISQGCYSSQETTLAAAKAYSDYIMGKKD